MLYYERVVVIERDVSYDKIFIDKIENATEPISHKIPKDPRCRRINATPKKESARTRESIDNVCAFSPSPPLLSLFFFFRPPKITRVWLAPVASMTKVGPGPRAGGCHVRIYISDFLFMQFFVREYRERVAIQR